MMEQYKSVPVRVPDKTPTDLLAIQKRFNQGFKREDIFLDLSPDACQVNVREVDMCELRATVDELIEAHDAKAAKTVLREALQAVESIRSYGLRGRKRLFVGYNRERKVRHRHDKEKRRGQHYYANDHEFSCHVNEPPIEYLDRVACGDSTELLAHLPDNCVDMVFTSPPYNFGLEYGQSPDDYQWEKYYEKLFGVLDECIRVLKFGGRIAVNVQPLFSDYIPSHHVISNFLMRRKLIWKGEIMWEKNNYNCKYTAWGSWRSPSSPYLKYTWEFIEVFCKGNLKAEGNSADADITADEFKQWVNARWSIAPERNMREYGHPAMFPVELATRVLKLFSFRGAFVLDPFAGVGTTAVAAKNSGRRYLNIDISPEYCEAANKRLAETLL